MMLLLPLLGVGSRQLERLTISLFRSHLAGLSWNQKIGGKIHNPLGLGVVVMKTHGCTRTTHGSVLALRPILLEEGVSHDGGDGLGEYGIVRKRQRLILNVPKSAG